MNKYELMDQLIIQAGNTTNVFGISLLLNKAFNRFAERFTKAAPSNAKTWQYLGSAALTYGQIISYMLALPALRNAIMMAVSKTTKFIDMVGLNGNKQEPPEVLKPAIQKYLQAAARTYAIGMGLSAGLATLGLLFARKGIGVPKALQWFQHHLGLPKGDYRKMGDAATILFWAYPVYLGWLLNSRDKAETTETLVKAGGFAFAFSILPRRLEKLLNIWLKHDPRGKEKAFIAQIISACIFYTALPTVSNLLFRRHRAEKYGLLDKPSATPLNEVALQVIFNDFEQPLVSIQTRKGYQPVAVMQADSVPA